MIEVTYCSRYLIEIMVPGIFTNLNMLSELAVCMYILRHCRADGYLASGSRFGTRIPEESLLSPLVLLTLPFALIDRIRCHHVAVRRKKLLKKPKPKPTEKKPMTIKGAKTRRSDRKLRRINKSTEEVVQFLKNSNLGRNRQRSRLFAAVVSGRGNAEKRKIFARYRFES